MNFTKHNWSALRPRFSLLLSVISVTNPTTISIWASVCKPQEKLKKILLLSLCRCNHTAVLSGSPAMTTAYAWCFWTTSSAFAFPWYSTAGLTTTSRLTRSSSLKTQKWNSIQIFGTALCKKYRRGWKAEKTGNRSGWYTTAGCLRLCSATSAGCFVWTAGILRSEPVDTKILKIWWNFPIVNVTI